MRNEQQDLASIFDNVVMDVLNSAIEKEWKVRFVQKAFEEVSGFGWEEYSRSDFWLYEIVQEAYKKFTGEDNE